MSGLTIRLPDGNEVDVQTDDPQVATAAARKHWERLQATPERPTAPQPRTAAQTAGDFAGDVVDNFFPNWGDEVAAIPDAAKALVAGKPVGEAFDQGRKDFKDHQAQYDTEHPWLSWASTLGGLGASLALPAGRVAEGASLGAKALHGAAVGAGYGAVSGAGQGQSFMDRAENALSGAAIGGLAGGAMTPVAEGAVRLGRRALLTVPGAEEGVRRLANIPRAVLRRPLVQRGQRATEQADRMLNQTMNRGNIQEGMGQLGAPATPDSIIAEQTRRQGMGVPAIPGDVTEPMRNLTSWASRGMGPGQTRVIQALDRRKADEANRVRNHVTAEMGPAVDPIRQVEQHTQRAQREAAPMYAEAYAQPMVLTPEIAAIARTPAFNDALPQAVRNIRNAQRDPEAMGFIMHGDGSVDPQSHQFLSTEAFDQVIRAMRDNGRAAADINPLTGRVINNTNSVHINARAGDLRSELANQNGAYRDVTGMYADEMALRDAFQNGQDVSKLTGPEIAAQGRGMTPDAQQSWTIGARSALADQASTFGANYPTGDTAATIRKSLGDAPKQAAIEQMTGNQGAVRGLQDRLEAEHQGNILWKEVQGNSRTAGRQQLDADLDAATGSLGPSSFSVRGMLGAAVSHIASRATAQFRNDVKARIAEVAAETNPANVRDFMSAIADRAQRDRQFADLLHRSGIIGTKAYGANIVAPNEDDWHMSDDGFLESPDGTMGIKFGDAP